MKRQAVWTVPVCSLFTLMLTLGWLPFGRALRIFLRFGQARKRSTLTPYGNRVPRTVHRLIRTAELKQGRLIIIGDVHGCHAELMQLLEKVKYHKERDNLFFVGDLVNKGPGSVDVIRTFKDAGAWAVRGNHCDSALRHWNLWSQKGVPPKHDWVTSMQAEDAAVLDSLPFSLNIPELGMAIVHAGLVPGGTHECQDMSQLLSRQHMKDMLCMRNLVPLNASQASSNGAGMLSAQGPHQVQHLTGIEVEQQAQRCAQPQSPSQAAPSLEPPSLSHMGAPPEQLQQELPAAQWRGTAEGEGGAGVAWAHIWPGPTHVFFGHDARRGLQLAVHVTGLDTGCVYGKHLTAAVLPPVALLLQRPTLRAHQAAWQQKEQQQPSEQEDGVMEDCGRGSASASKRGRQLPGVSRQDLQCQIVQVAAFAQYAAVNED